MYSSLQTRTPPPQATEKIISEPNLLYCSFFWRLWRGQQILFEQKMKQCQILWESRKLEVRANISYKSQTDKETFKSWWFKIEEVFVCLPLEIRMIVYLIRVRMCPEARHINSIYKEWKKTMTAGVNQLFWVNRLRKKEIIFFFFFFTLNSHFLAAVTFD